MVVFPNAKINLGLNILSKREDGYHNISSVFYPVPLQDILEIIPSKAFRFNTSGLDIPGELENNLIVKAYHLLREEFDLPPVHIHLHKVIPMGAGLGGGSANAAFTIKLLNNLFELSLTEPAMESYAGNLGSDCPFFIKNKPLLAEGRGTEFSDVSVGLSGMWLILLCPNIHVSTAEAYKNVEPHIPEHRLKEVIEKTSVAEWKDLVKNDFERSVFRLYPKLEQFKKQLYTSGAVYSSMTGSGSGIYGLFEGEPISLSLPNICWKGKL